jgi:hypothetical protein
MGRVFGGCVTLLAAALAVYVAVRLIESVAAAIVIIAAAIGGLVIFSVAARAVWRSRRFDRW